MAWNLTLQDASFRGVTFDVQSVEDRGEKALCIHEYPYRSGAEVEDLGRKPRVIPVTAIFWGVAYESRIKALVAAFEEAGPGELIHPVFGSLTVAVRRWQIQHSAERHDYATVTFEAVEAVTDNPFFGATSSRSLAEQALADISASLDEALGLSERELGKTLGQWADTAANMKARVETELQGVLDVLDAGRSVVRSVLSYVDVPAAFVADAQAIVRGLQADAASASSSVAWVQSYADERCQGLGVVYQACSFLYLGSHTSLFYELDGKVYHKLLLTAHKLTSRRGAYLAENIDRAKQISLRQYRYVRFLKTDWIKRLRMPILPYPKRQPE